MTISQRHLALLEHCPRRYQAEMLDCRSLPIPAPQRHAMQRGQQFHHLVQQRALGLDSQLHDPELDRWLDRLSNATALQPDDGQYYLAEHARILALPPFELLVRYDALLANGDRADILDWKTYPRPQHPQTLNQHWQTRLYRYVLAATSDYAPSQIAMTYWFAEPPRSASATNSETVRAGSDRVTLPYSAEQFERDQSEIGALLDRLAALNAAESVFPSRGDLGLGCDPDRCACTQLHLLDNGTASTCPVSDISAIEEVAP